MLKKIVTFFDKLEDAVRGRLARHPIIYAIIGAIGIVLVWKGIWETAELFPTLHGPASAILGAFILLVTGLMVSFFIGDTIIISGIKKEKKLVEKTSDEVKSEGIKMSEVARELERIELDLKELKRRL